MYSQPHVYPGPTLGLIPRLYPQPHTQAQPSASYQDPTFSLIPKPNTQPKFCAQSFDDANTLTEGAQGTIQYVVQVRTRMCMFQLVIVHTFHTLW